MSAQVTEAHRELAESVYWARETGKTGVSAQLIANSEAKATAQLRAEVERLRGYSDELDGVTNALGDALARAERAEAELAKAKAILASIEEDGTEEHNAAVSLRQELATERARLDWLLSRMGGNVLPVNGCVAWTVDVYHYKNQFPSRAAIDAAIKEETK